MPFKIDSVRVALPPLKIGEPVVKNEQVAAYRNYYGIDFENQIPGLSVSLGTIDVVGYSVVVHVFKPVKPKATVFVMHGYYDHVGIYDHMIEYLLQQSYAVISYDLPGHGLTTGDLVAIPDFHRYQVVFKTVIEYVASDLPQPWHLVGQSTGAAIIIDYLASHHFQDECPFQKFVLLAPLIRPRNWGLNKKLHALMSLIKNYAVRKFSLNSHDTSFLHFLSLSDPLQSRFLSGQWVFALKKWVPKIESSKPVPFSPLIIQGQLDGTVQWENNLLVLKRLFKSPEIVYFPRMRHQVVNEHVSIRNEVFALVGRHLSRA